MQIMDKVNYFVVYFDMEASDSLVSASENAVLRWIGKLYLNWN